MLFPPQRHRKMTREALEPEINRWKIFATQTDWSGCSMRETWYGHHEPCRRIALFVHLSSLLATIVFGWHAFGNWPVLRPNLGRSDLERIKKSHADCFEAICSAVFEIEFDCVMTSSRRLRVDTNSIVGDLEGGVVSLPRVCYDAIYQTFGDDLDLWFQRIDAASLDLLHLRQEAYATPAQKKQRFSLLQLVPNECVLHEHLIEWILFGDSRTDTLFDVPMFIDLVDPSRVRPGERKRIQLRSFACPEHMPKVIRDEILPLSNELYERLLEWRKSATICFVYWTNMAYFSALSTSRMFLLLVPAILIWSILPKGEVKGRRISLFSTVSTLMLLVSLSALGEGDLPEGLRACLLAASAAAYGNRKAAVEWGFLFLVSYLDASILTDIWNENIVAGLRAHGLWGIFSWIEKLLTYLVPGEGFLKLVTMYVIYQAFPRQQVEANSNSSTLRTKEE